MRRWVVRWDVWWGMEAECDVDCDGGRVAGALGLRRARIQNLAVVHRQRARARKRACCDQDRTDQVAW